MVGVMVLVEESRQIETQAAVEREAQVMVVAVDGVMVRAG